MTTTLVDRNRPRRRAAAAACLAVLLGLPLAAGCAGGRAAPAAAEPRADTSPLGRCPPPLVWRDGDGRPRAVRIENPRPVPLVVYLDGCIGSHRIGDVPPGTTVTYALPGRLVPFPGGLRFHVYPSGVVDDYFAATVPLAGAGVVHLPVPERTPPPCERRLYVDGVLWTGTARDFTPEDLARVEVEFPAAAGLETATRCPVLHLHRGASSRPGALRRGG
jgi:hypothetical protein